LLGGKWRRFACSGCKGGCIDCMGCIGCMGCLDSMDSLQPTTRSNADQHGPSSAAALLRRAGPMPPELGRRSRTAAEHGRA